MPADLGPAVDTHSRRLYALIRRLSVIGAILGGLLFLVLMCLMLWPAQWVTDRGVGGMIEIPAAGGFMSGMLLFYSLRARATFGRMSPSRFAGIQPHAPAAGRRPPMPFLKSDLNKIRLMATPLLAVLLLMLATDLGAASIFRAPLPYSVTASDQQNADLMPFWLTADPGLSRAQLISVRRAAWEIARIEGVPFDAIEARGFAVLSAVGTFRPGRPCQPGLTGTAGPRAGSPDDARAGRAPGSAQRSRPRMAWTPSATGSPCCTRWPHWAWGFTQSGFLRGSVLCSFPYPIHSQW